MRYLKLFEEHNRNLNQKVNPKGEEKYVDLFQEDEDDDTSDYYHQSYVVSRDNLFIDQTADEFKIK